MLSGSIEIDIDGRKKVWEAGHTAWVSANVPQQARCVSDNGTRFFVVRLHITTEDNTVIEAPRSDYLVPTPRDLLNTLDTCMDLHSLPSAISRQRLRWLLGDVFAQILQTHEFLSQMKSSASKVGLTHQQRRTMQTWLYDHLTEEPQVSDLAKLCGLEPTTFRRHFQRTYGQSPRTWIAQERIRVIAAMIRDSDSPIQHIAARGGFRSIPSFNRAFKQLYGVNPQQWRLKEEES